MTRIHPVLVVLLLVALLALVAGGTFFLGRHVRTARDAASQPVQPNTEVEKK